jgi:hypothetical protein
VGVLWVLFTGYINCLSQVYVDRMHWSHFKHGEYKPLPDIGFILLPKLSVTRLPDLWNVFIVVSTLLPVLLLHPHKVKVIRRYAAIQGTCFLLRSITIMATILPNPYSECVNTSSETEVAFIEAFRVMAGARITCGDVLYSGHAANFTLMAMIWQEYGKTYTDSPQPMDLYDHLEHQSIPPPPSKFSWYCSVFFPRLFWLVAVLGYLIIIACRFHYTVDVVVGIVVVGKQWGLYHMIIRTPQLLEHVPVLQWFESKGVYKDSKPSIDHNESEWRYELTPRRGSLVDSGSPGSGHALTGRE